MRTKSASILIAVAIGAALAAVSIAQQPGRAVSRTDEGYSLPSSGLELESVPRFRVALIHQARLTGKEPGVLVEVNVVEGQHVKAGDVLAIIDDKQPKLQGQIAMQEYEAAKEKAENDVDVRYAQKATELAKVEYDKSREINRNRPGTVADIDVRRQELTWQRGQLETERALSERKIAIATAEAKRIEIEAAKEAVYRRQIISPIDGVVEKVHLHKGEWVQPGEPVVHVVQLDKLKVEGEFDIKQYSPGQLMNRPVMVEAELQGRKVQFEGRITFVRPLLDGRGRNYVVKAEVENRFDKGHPLLMPGLYVDMTVNAADARLTRSE
jgi:multidrug efflux pump subunit AcrA (membrane-fusion protein)